MGMWFGDLPGFNIIDDQKFRNRFKNWFLILVEILILISSFINICISAKVYYLMKTRHYFEFKRTKRSMENQLLIIIIYFINIVANSVYDFRYNYYELVLDTDES